MPSRVAQPGNQLRGLETWKRLLAYAMPHRARMAVATLASVISAAAAAASSYLLGPLAKTVLTGGSTSIAGRPVAIEALETQIPLAIVVLAVLKALSAWLNSGLMNAVAQDALRRLKRDLYGKLLRLPPQWFETRHSGELTNRFTSDVTAAEFAVSQALVSWVKDSIMVVALLVVCFTLDWRLSLLVFVVLPAMVLPVSRFARATRAIATAARAKLAGLTTLVAEHLANLSVVQAYRAEGQALQRFDAEQADYERVMRRSLFIRGAFTPTTEFIGIVGVAVALVFGARAVAQEPALADRMLSFVFATLWLYQPVKALSGTVGQVAQSLGPAQRLFELLDAAPERTGGETVEPLKTALRFDHLSVVYPDGRTGAADVSFTIPHGKVVALVGPSGAGKSTVVSALLGFVETAPGQLLWDGVDLAMASRQALRAQLAWVPQDVVLLSGSVRENVLLARPQASEAELQLALKRAHAAELVAALPQGLDTPVGERGARLSGGERQRLALARAFLRAPSLLVLDEPTSALDAGSEAEVQAGLEELMAGRTTLVIAHRLSTVRKADLIVVLEAGRVVQQGTHGALAGEEGVYRRLLAAAGREGLR